MTVQASSAGPPGNALAQAYVDRCVALGAAVSDDWLAAGDVAYGPDPKQVLDVFRPPGDSADMPVLVFFHGGGFTAGGKDWCRFMAPIVCAFPAILVCASYRLVPQVEVRDQVADAAAATAWVAANIATYGGSPDRIIVGGHSAGGALAALVTASPGLLPVNLLPQVRGAICLSATLGQFPVTGTPGSAYVLPKGPLPLDPDGPLAQANRMAKPFLIGWGGRERQLERVERSSMAMIGALRDRGQAVRWLYLPEADHFETHLVLADSDHPWSAALKLWIAETCA